MAYIPLLACQRSLWMAHRMSNTKEALRLITTEKYDIHKAVEFCKEYDDVDLWHDLIDFSIDKPYFIQVLLQNIGKDLFFIVLLVYFIRN